MFFIGFGMGIAVTAMVSAVMRLIRHIRECFVLMAELNAQAEQRPSLYIVPNTEQGV